MTKRNLWFINCLIWAGIWFVLGVFFIPFWVFSILSVMMMLLPVGYVDKPENKIRHNPNDWKRNDES